MSETRLCKQCEVPMKFVPAGTVMNATGMSLSDDAWHCEKCGLISGLRPDKTYEFKRGDQLTAAPVEYGGKGRVVIDSAKLQGTSLSEELEKIGIVELSNCKIICDPLTAAPQFVQEPWGIREPQQPTDQQRSDAGVIEQVVQWDAAFRGPVEKIRAMAEKYVAQDAAIAERDATIASLQRWGDSLLDENGKIKTLVKEKKEQITALQARVRDKDEEIAELREELKRFK